MWSFYVVWMWTTFPQGMAEMWWEGSNQSFLGWTQDGTHFVCSREDGKYGSSEDSTDWYAELVLVKRLGTGEVSSAFSMTHWGEKRFFPKEVQSLVKRAQPAKKWEAFQRTRAVTRGQPSMVSPSGRWKLKLVVTGHTAMALTEFPVVKGGPPVESPVGSLEYGIHVMDHGLTLRAISGPGPTSVYEGALRVGVESVAEGSFYGLETDTIHWERSASVNSLGCLLAYWHPQEKYVVIEWRYYPAGGSTPSKLVVSALPPIKKPDKEK